MVAPAPGYSRPMDLSEAEIDRIRSACTRWVGWHGDPSPAEMLSQLPADITTDRYGEGGVVEELETRLAELLGKPAAAFFVSGTMAQQIALRIHADHSNRRTVAFHPTCHIELQGSCLRTPPSTRRETGRGPVRAASAERPGGNRRTLAAFVLELPQREIGGQLPGWEELVAQTDWARATGPQPISTVLGSGSAPGL